MRVRPAAAGGPIRVCEMLNSDQGDIHSIRQISLVHGAGHGNKKKKKKKNPNLTKDGNGFSSTIWDGTVSGYFHLLVHTPFHLQTFRGGVR